MLGRPHRMGRLLDSVRRATPHAEVVFIVCKDDPQHKTITGVAQMARQREEEKDGQLQIIWIEADWPSGCRGDYGRKLNLAIDLTDREWLFLGAIDLCFCASWYEQARLAARQTGALVVGTNDLCNPRTMGGHGVHSTHSLVDRRYVDRGTADDETILLHEGYPHEFVDDEFVRTAQWRGVYVHAAAAHVEHLHPSCGKEHNDPLYARQSQRIGEGRQVFLARQHLWEGTVR